MRERFPAGYVLCKLTFLSSKLTFLSLTRDASPYRLRTVYVRRSLQGGLCVIDTPPCKIRAVGVYVACFTVFYSVLPGGVCITSRRGSGSGMGDVGSSGRVIMHIDM